IPTGADRSSAVAWSNAGAGSYTTYGSSSDLWGTTWTISDINDANFGVYLIARNTATANAPQVGVDHIRVTVYYTSATGIKTSQSTHAFSVYPNPASSAVTIHADIRIQSIHVRNLMGEVVYTANPAQSRSLAIDLSSHPRGIYFVEIVDENQNSSVEKITLE
ncbi:MAG: T9SS type A sorting domain-containing protein, partial [Cytophagaceae bacterium]